MLAVVCILLGVYSSVFANDCKEIKPLDEFSLEKFSGKWYLGSMKIGNPSEQARYKDISCGTVNINIDAEKKPTNWTAGFLLGGEEVYLGGKYEISDNTKGAMKAEFAPRSLNYDMIVKCSDYDTYAIVYACVQVIPGESSEFIHLFLRDPMKFDEIIASPEIKKCFADISPKPIEEDLQKLPSDICPNLHNH